MITWHGHYSALVLREYVDQPIMHLFKGCYGVGEDRADYTMCGRRAAKNSTWMAVRHLIKFCRPCKRCDAAGARQLAA
jgi:hypothetical protein